MIVECDKCSTRFQLDDERIPATGIRVRCSRCKQAFFLKHPEVSEQEAVDAIASEAARLAAPAVPEPATDLAGTSLDDLENFDPAGVLDDDEDDWEFNHDTQDSAGLPASETGSGFDSASPSGLELGGDADVADAVDPGSSGSFGTVEDFGNLADEVLSDSASEPLPELVPALATETPPPSGLEADIADVIDSLNTLSVDDPPAAGEEAVGSDLGEPEDWDLLGEEEASADVDSSHRLPAAEEAPTHMRSAVAEAQARPARREPAPRAGRAAASAPRGLRLAASAVGWLAFSGLFVGALVQGLATSFDPVPVVSSYELGSLIADSVETQWITVGAGETLLVVRGVLHNPLPSARVVGVSVAVDLLDAEGRPLDHPPALAGRPLPTDELRTLAPAARSAAMLAASGALSRERLAADRSVEFAAYFTGLPAQARRVSLRAQEIGSDSFEAPWRQPVEPQASPSAEGEAKGPASRP